MSTDVSGITDEVAASLGRGGSATDGLSSKGSIIAELFGEDGTLKQRVEIDNVITDVGDQRYGEAGAGISTSVAAPVSMQVGNATTAATKNGAGAGPVSLTGITGNTAVTNNPALPVSSLTGGKRRLVYTGSWAAGAATGTLNEVVLTNVSSATQTAHPAANVLARAVLSPAVSKGAADTLTITWNHDIGT